MIIYFFSDIFIQGLSAGMLIAFTAGFITWGTVKIYNAWYYIAK